MSVPPDAAPFPYVVMDFHGSSLRAREFLTRWSTPDWLRIAVLHEVGNFGREALVLGSTLSTIADEAALWAARGSIIVAQRVPDRPNIILTDSQRRERDFGQGVRFTNARMAVAFLKRCFRGRGTTRQAEGRGRLSPAGARSASRRRPGFSDLVREPAVKSATGFLPAEREPERAAVRMDRAADDHNRGGGYRVIIVVTATVADVVVVSIADAAATTIANARAGAPFRHRQRGVDGRSGRRQFGPGAGVAGCVGQRHAVLRAMRGGGAATVAVRSVVVARPVGFRGSTGDGRWLNRDPRIRSAPTRPSSTGD